MAVDNRPDRSKSYYARSERVEGKRVKKYVGPCGEPVTDLLFRIDRLAHAEKEAARQADAEAVALDKATVAPLADEYHRQAGILTRATLVATGFIRRQGRWARSTTGDPVAARLRPTPENPQDPLENLAMLSKTAERGDRSATQQIKAALAEHPQLYQQTSDLASHLQEHLITRIAGTDQRLEHALRMRCRELIARTASGVSDEIDRLMGERVMLAWLDLQQADAAANQPRQRHADGDYWEKRLHRAQKRFDEATKWVAEMQAIQRCWPAPKSAVATAGDDNENADT